MDLIFGNEGGAVGHMTTQIKKKSGSSSSGEITRSEKTSISTEVSTSISAGFIFDKMDIDASLKSDWESAMASTYQKSQVEETDFMFEVFVDLSKPAYWYRTTIAVYSANGGVLYMNGDSQIIQNHPVVNPCIDVDVETIAVDGYVGMANMFANAGQYIRDVVPQDSELIYDAKVEFGKQECDKDPECQSFTVATWDGERDGHNVCLYKANAAGYSHSTNWDAYVKKSAGITVI